MFRTYSAEQSSQSAAFRPYSPSCPGPWTDAAFSSIVAAACLSWSATAFLSLSTTVFGVTASAGVASISLLIASPPLSLLALILLAQKQEAHSCRLIWVKVARCKRYASFDGQPDHTEGGRRPVSRQRLSEVLPENRKSLR